MTETATRVRVWQGTDLIGVAAILQVCLAFFMISGLSNALLNAPPSADAAFEDRESGTPLLQALNLVIYLPSLLFMMARPMTALRTLGRGWVYTFLLAFSVASILWSVQPDITLRRALALCVAMLFVVHVSNFYTPHQFIRIMAYIFGGLILASVLAVAIPGYGITPNGVHVGRWRGIMADKNALGWMSGVACIAFLTLALTPPRFPRERMMWAGMLAIGFVVLVMANSRTPLLGFVAGSSAIGIATFVHLPWAAARRLSKSLRISVVGLAVAFALIAVPASISIVFALLGRKPTLTGRSKLWEYAIDKGWDRPWFGTGFKSFWIDKNTFELRVLHQYWSKKGEVAKMTGNAHNAYLDTWLELGVFGLFILFVMFGVIAWRGNVALSRTRDPIFLWHIGTIAFAIVFYAANGFALSHNAIVWFMVSYAFYSLSALRPLPGPVPNIPTIYTHQR